MCHDRKWLRQFRIHGIGKNLADHVLEKIPDFLFTDKRHFTVDLGEFRLAIRSQILITETLRNLVITVESGNHQQLLEQLGRLRQREKFSRIDP